MYIGEVAEWSKALVLKTRDPLRGPWVRIPPSPLIETGVIKKPSVFVVSKIAKTLGVDIEKLIK